MVTPNNYYVLEHKRFLVWNYLVPAFRNLYSRRCFSGSSGQSEPAGDVSLQFKIWTSFEADLPLEHRVKSEKDRENNAISVCCKGVTWILLMHVMCDVSVLYHKQMIFTN